MNNNTLGIILGGLLPALLYGFSAITMKAGAGYKISTPDYLMIIGIVIFLIGLLVKPILSTEGEKLNSIAIIFSVSSGLLWALGTTLVNYSIARFSSPIAILTPLYNMNTLVAVLGGIIIFGEWKTLNSVPVFIGTILIVGGGILLSRA
jgi:glucose uptake protein GlcU